MDHLSVGLYSQAHLYVDGDEGTAEEELEESHGDPSQLWSLGRISTGLFVYPLPTYCPSFTNMKTCMSCSFSWNL